jgi:hypothetical protein
MKLCITFVRFESSRYDVHYINFKKSDDKKPPEFGSETLTASEDNKVNMSENKV